MGAKELSGPRSSANFKIVFRMSSANTISVKNELEVLRKLSCQRMGARELMTQIKVEEILCTPKLTRVQNPFVSRNLRPYRGVRNHSLHFVMPLPS